MQDASSNDGKHGLRVDGSLDLSLLEKESSGALNVMAERRALAYPLYQGELRP